MPISVQLVILCEIITKLQLTLQKFIIEMDKLKQILAAKKKDTKITYNKQVLQKQKQEYFKQEEKLKQKQYQQSIRKQKQIEEFYGQARKIVKLNQNSEPKDSAKTEQQQADLQAKRQQIADRQFKKKLKEVQQYEELDVKFRSKFIEPRLMDDLNIRKKKTEMIQKEKDLNYSDVCDQVFLWLSKVIRDWNQALQHKYHSKQDHQQSKKSYMRFNQSQRDLSSFIKVLKNRGGDKQMITSVYHIMNCCLVREYVQANDKYIQLSIGNAPWPMGVAMLGITVKKNAQRLSHVLNEQMTRRWMQSIKRLISVSQQMYPNEDKLKMVGYSVTSII